MAHKWTMEEKRVLSQLGDLHDSTLVRVIKAVFGWEPTDTQVRAFLHRNGVSRASKKHHTLATKSFSRLIADVFVQRFPEAEGKEIHSTHDCASVVGVYLGGNPVIVNCKNMRDLDFNDWVKNAQEEAEEKGTPYWIVTHKHIGYPESEAFVTMTLDQYIKQVWRS